MDRHQWIVSDPPHGEVDVNEAAMLLGLAAADARIKFNFGAPEVWLAYSEEDQAAAVLNALRATGLSVRLVPADDLLSVPAPIPVLSLSFAKDGLAADTEDGEVHVPYDTPVIATFCKPPSDFASGDRESPPTRVVARGTIGPRSRNQIVDRLVGLGHSRSQQDTVDMLERRTNLDLYFPGDGGLRRISIAQGVADLSALGDGAPPRAGHRMDFCVAECERRLTNLALDKRLVNVRPRRRLTVGGGAPGGIDRKGFSFGTVGLQDLLKSVSPELVDITQFELGSRLSFLMRRGDDPTWTREGEGATASQG